MVPGAAQSNSHADVSTTSSTTLPPHSNANATATTTRQGARLNTQHHNTMHATGFERVQQGYR